MEPNFVMPPPAVPDAGQSPPTRRGATGSQVREALLWGLGGAALVLAAGTIMTLAGTDEGIGWLLWPGAAALVLLLIVPLAFAFGMAKARRAAEWRSEILSEAFHALPQPRLIVDWKGHVVAVNPAFDEMFDVDGPGPMEALRARLGATEPAAAELERMITNAAVGKADRSEINVPGPSGDTEWFNVTVTPIAARPGYAEWRIEDVTARRQLEQVVREEHEFLLDFLENAPVGFYSVNEEGRFLFVNETLAEWLGRTPEEILNGNMRLGEFVTGAGAPPLDPAAAKSGQQHAEVTLKGRHGREIQAHVSQSVVEARDGAGLRTRSVVRDLTSEREWQEALRQSEHRFARFFEDAPVGIALVDRKGRIRECNRAFGQLAGPERDELIGRPLAELISGEDRPRTQERLNKVAAGSDPGVPLQIRLHGEPERVASLFVSRMEDGGADSSGLILHFLDTTELKKLETQFTQSQKMQAIGQLAGGVAHDFNNLLTAMIGFCDLLLLRHRPGEQSFADIMQIKQNANRAANLVRQLLAFTRQQTVQPKVLNVTDVLTEISNLLRRLIGEKIDLKMVHGRDLVSVRVDQGQLEQVIVNLAVNARDAMAEGGELTIRTGNATNAEPVRQGLEEMPAGEYVLIEIGDTGAGIPAEHIDRIFEPFFSTKEMGSGTGLGLSTVHGIVKQAGGHVFVDSEVGRGTTFRIYLPAYRGEEMGEARPGEVADSAVLSDLTGASTVMLVEDEDAVRLFSARALRNKGYKVLEAKGGGAAIELFKTAEGPIDVLITDVVMPDMDGPALVQWVREHRPGMRVICISGYAEETFRKRLDAASDIHFLPKPFSLEQLASKVKEVMRQPAA
jgi:two-component system cell cycle sensor histidine kinase/response regulator CckA